MCFYFYMCLFPKGRKALTNCALALDGVLVFERARFKRDGKPLAGYLLS